MEDYEFGDMDYDLEDEMQRELLEQLAQELDEPEPILLTEEPMEVVKEKEPAVIEELNKSSSSTNSNYNFTSYKPIYEKARNPTPAEFAVELQHARQRMLNNNGTADSSVAHTLLNVTDMITQREHTIPKAADSEKFLHKFCEESASDHVPCILANGTRFYIRKRTDISKSPSSSNGSSENSLLGKGDLLSKPMSELQKEADRIQTEVLADRKLREEARRNADLYGSSVHDEDLCIESALRSATETASSSSSGATEEKSLWVDKYAPMSFSQLLSEEKINREVLSALRAWSPYVFKSEEKAGSLLGGKSAPASAPGTLGAGGARSAAKDRNAPRKDNRADQSDDSDSDNEVDHRALKNQDTRPYHKALLICGPPGTGKTTLAHVVAKHCGYRPFEVNASDDRSHDVLKDTLMRAMHGNTVYGERLPNCIILDEIDGIDGKNSIDMLVKMIRAPLRMKGQKGKTQSSATPITRPLICICNDQYAPSLRELRKYARVFVFHPPSEQRLVARLKAICATEKISNVSPHSLSALSSATGNDIRSAINTLQFAALRTSTLKTASAGDTTKASSFGRMLSNMISSGLKDVNRDAFQVWKEIFSVREMALAAAKKKSILMNNREVAGLPSGQKGLIAAANGTHSNSLSLSSMSGSVSAMQAMSDFGDSNLILSGIFHNLLSIRYNDPSMTRSHLASDWISAVDQFDSFASGSGGNSGSGGGNHDSIGYQLMPYISCIAGAVHLYCSADEKVKISWPTSEKDAFYKRKSKSNILETLLHSAKLGTFCMSGKTPVALDVLSFLLDITTPKVRPVSFLTLTPTEQEAIAECVEVMAAVGLSYTTTTPAIEGAFYTGSHNFTLDPAITELVCYNCDDLKNR